MSLAMKFVRNKIDSLTLSGGIVMLLDSIWGGIIVLGLDLRHPYELVLAISLVIGFPVYILDLWIDKRIPIFMIGLFLFRWIVRCFGVPVPALCNPLRGSVLLIAAFVLFQWSKLRREQILRRPEL